MRFSTKILESNEYITQQILKSILPEVQRYFMQLSGKLEKQIQTLVKNAIINSPEYQSILSGKLQYHFGIPDPQNRLSRILSIWEKIHINTIKPKIKSSLIYGKIELLMINKDYSDVLTLNESSIVTEKGDTLNWLNWLLLLGDKTIIKEYDIQVGPNPHSRTGRAVMKKTVNGKWKVPSEFAGTINSNWITRVLDSISSEIDTTIQNAIK